MIKGELVLVEEARLYIVEKFESNHKSGSDGKQISFSSPICKYRTFRWTFLWNNDNNINSNCNNNNSVLVYFSVINCILCPCFHSESNLTDKTEYMLC